MILLRLILIFLLIYLLIRFLGRILLSISRPQQFNNDTYRQNNSGRREGDVYIKHDPQKKEKIIKKNDGEYINYEEIKDE